MDFMFSNGFHSIPYPQHKADKHAIPFPSRGEKLTFLQM